MAIRRGHENVAAQFGLAELAGIAEARQIKDQQAFQLARDFQQKQDRMELAIFNEELKKNSVAQQMQWEYDKLQISQQNRFELEEQIRSIEALEEAKDRMRKKAEYEALTKAINESEILDDTEKGRFLMNAQSRFTFGSGAPRLDITSDLERQRQDLAQNRYELSLESAARAEQSNIRAEEAHRKRMEKGASFSEMRAAETYLEEHPTPKWWKPFDSLSEDEKRVRREAQTILSQRTVPDTGGPANVEEFKQMVKQLAQVDPVKAQQYHAKYVNQFIQ
ncbi:MAG: hypothetical protein ACXABY_02815 [Candidatus Thorarchaeota archaeon]|jgi:hypothetical protein